MSIPDDSESSFRKSPEYSQGMRDFALLSIMYDSAARVQEIADLCVNDFRLEKPSTLRLTGKGQKTRIIPLMNTTTDLLSKYIKMFHPYHQGEQGIPLFSNRNRTKLTRAGISYILSKRTIKQCLFSNHNP